MKQVILNLINEVDYDIYKDLNPETAEDPEYAERHLAELASMLEEQILNLGYIKSSDHKIICM